MLGDLKYFIAVSLSPRAKWDKLHHFVIKKLAAVLAILFFFFFICISACIVRRFLERGRFLYFSFAEGKVKIQGNYNLVTINLSRVN